MTIPILSFAQALSTLRTWGQLARSLALSQCSVVFSWDPVRRLTTTATPLFNALAKKVNELLDASDCRFSPLADPLRLDFAVHRWLRGNREEAYSDWLAWIVQHLDAATTYGLFNL